MITAIFTTNKTTLTIETSEMLTLVQMGREDQPIELTEGVNNIPVGAGVFQVLSKALVRVTADTPDLYVAYTTTNTKDGGFPDPPKSVTVDSVKLNIDSTAVRQFFDARGDKAPR